MIRRNYPPEFYDGPAKWDFERRDRQIAEATTGIVITKKTRSAWYPEQQIETYVDKEYRCES